MQFRNENYFLSNMYPVDIKLGFNGKIYTFRCAESAFQACKNIEEIEKFLDIDGYAAKKLGKKIKLRADWEDVKLICMQVIVDAKFRQNPELMEKLLKIKEPIVEDNTWGDCFWGVCRGKGENNLGKILEKVREKYSKL